MPTLEVFYSCKGLLVSGRHCHGQYHDSLSGPESSATGVEVAIAQQHTRSIPHCTV